MQDRKIKGKKESGDFFYKFIAVFIPLFLVVTIGFYFVQRSGVIERNYTAASVGNVKINVPEYAYYYRNVYGTYAQYFSMYGVDESKPLEEQMFSETQSWADYLKMAALEQAQSTVSLAESAKKAGVQLTKEDWDEINAKLRDIDLSAKDQNASTDSLLQSMYGRYASRGMIRGIYEREALASKYYTQEQERVNAAVTEDDINSAYAADKNTYDLVDYRYLFFSSTPEAKQDEEGNDIEATEDEKAAAQAAAQAAAKASANAMLGKVTDEASFTAAARDSLSEDKLAGFNEASTIAEKAAFSSLATELGTWLFDDARKAGDKSVIETSSGYYVALFKSRYRDESATVTVRHILLGIGSAGGEDGEDEAKQAENDKKAKDKSDEVYAKWQEDPTEDNFAALAEKNSTDSGSAVNGGLIERITRDTTVEEFDAWCFDPARKSGDTGIVKTTYGYHIIYFLKTDIEAWKVPVISSIAGEKMTKFTEDLKEAYPLGQNLNGIARALDSYNMGQQS